MHLSRLAALILVVPAGIEPAGDGGLALHRDQGRKPSLSDNDAAAVAGRLAEGESASALAREFGVSRATAYNTRVRLAGSARPIPERGTRP
jgi:hypothetical protein